MVALGAGAASVAAGVFTAVLTNPLGIEDPDQVVVYRGAYTSLAGNAQPRPDEMIDYKAILPGVAHLAAYSEHDASVNLVSDGLAVRVRGAEISDEFFEALRIPLAAGRDFSKADLRSGQNRVVILGYDLARRLYGDNRDISERTVRLNDVSFSVIGIASRGMRFPANAELWIPISLGADRITFSPAISFQVFGRLQEGWTPGRATEGYEAFVREAGRQLPDSWPTRQKVEVRPLATEVVGASRFVLQILNIALVLVWVAALANIAAMLAGRADARRNEFWIQKALGASPHHVLQQFLLEGTALAVLSFLLGIGTAILSLQAIVRVLPAHYGGTADLWPTAETLAICAAMAVATGVIAVLPGLRLALNAKVGEGRLYQISPGRVTARNLRAPAVFQLTASVLLLICTSVLARSLFELGAVDLGFSPSGVVTAGISVPHLAGSSTPRDGQVYLAVMERVAALKGVTSVGATSALPLSGTDVISLSFRISGAPRPDAFSDRFGLVTAVAGEYFKTIRLPLLAGRYFDNRDSAFSRPVIIVNESLAKRYGGQEAVLGKEIQLPGFKIPPAVIGVVGDSKHLGPLREAGQQIFLAHAQAPFRLTSLVVRSSGGLQQLAAQIREVVAEIDPTLAVYDAKPFDEVVRDSASLQRRAFAIAGLFAVIALLLAGTGVFAALHRFVVSSRRELGIRLALGASRTDIVRIVLRHAAPLAIAGAALGSGLAFWGLSFLSASQFGVLAALPADYGLGSAVVFAATCLAALPALATALAVDPTSLLKSD